METRENIHNETTTELEIKIGDKKIPMTLGIAEDGYFGLGNHDYPGEFVIGGILNKEQARISHIIIPESLRGKGVGKTLLSELEKQLESRGVKNIFPTFSKVQTIEFFLGNGYDIIPAESLTEEEKHGLDLDRIKLDEEILDQEDFDQVKKMEKNQKRGQLSKKILLRKGFDNG